MEFKHVLSLSDEELLEEIKTLKMEKKMKTMVNMNLHINKQQRLEDLLYDKTNRGLD